MSNLSQRTEIACRIMPTLAFQFDMDECGAVLTAKMALVYADALLAHTGDACTAEGDYAPSYHESEQIIKDLEGRIAEMRRNISWILECVDAINKGTKEGKVMVPKEWLHVRKLIRELIKRDDQKANDDS